MNTLRLRFPNGELDDLVLGPGVHAVGQDVDGRPCLVDKPQDARLQVSIDRRGIWLQLREQSHSLHVNGRPVRRMAMLRAGDALHMDGIDLLLVGARPQPLATGSAGPLKRHVVLRALGGPNHGRCFDVDRSCTVGSAFGVEVCLAEPGIAPRHSRLEPQAGGVALHPMDAVDGVEVNGHRIAEGLLMPGDQVVFGANHRFVLEAPQMAVFPVLPSVEMSPEVEEPDILEPVPRSPLMMSLRRMPWLLLAALLLAGALALLLLYGTR